MRFLACFGVLDPILATYMATILPAETNVAGPTYSNDLSTGSTADLADGGGVGHSGSVGGFRNLMRNEDADSGLLGGA